MQDIEYLYTSRLKKVLCTLKHTNSEQPRTTSVQSVYTLGTHNVQSTFKVHFANYKKYYWKEITQYSTSLLHIPKQKQLIQNSCELYILLVYYQDNPVLSHLVTGT